MNSRSSLPLALAPILVFPPSRLVLTTDPRLPSLRPQYDLNLDVAVATVSDDVARALESAFGTGSAFQSALQSDLLLAASDPTSPLYNFAVPSVMSAAALTGTPTTTSAPAPGPVVPAPDPGATPAPGDDEGATDGGDSEGGSGGGGMSGGAIAAAVLVPILVVGLGVGLFIFFRRNPDKWDAIIGKFSKKKKDDAQQAPQNFAPVVMDPTAQSPGQARPQSPGYPPGYPPAGQVPQTQQAQAYRQPQQPGAVPQSYGAALAQSYGSPGQQAYGAAPRAYQSPMGQSPAGMQPGGSPQNYGARQVRRILIPLADPPTSSQASALCVRHIISMSLLP